MAVIDLKNKKQPHGKLTALEFIRLDPERGAIWNCRCECGNTREVPTKYFNSRRRGIKVCVNCTSPLRRAIQAQLGKRLGDEWSTPDFDNSFIAHISQFNFFQRLLLETAADGRYKDQVIKEAADIVIHSKNIDDEIFTYQTTRIKQAIRRLRHIYGSRLSKEY